MSEECDHKGKNVVCPSSAGPCCEGCGEPWPYEDKSATTTHQSSHRTLEDIVENSLRIWFGNYDKMGEADKATYRVPMREIVSFVAVSKPEPSVAFKALREISSLGFVAAKDAPQAHDEVVNIARQALSALSAYGPEVAVPEGWQLVPKVITPEMAAELNLTGTFADAAMQVRYAAALSKAPKAPAGALSQLTN